MLTVYAQLRYGECGKQLLYCASIPLSFRFVKSFLKKNNIFFATSDFEGKLFLFSLLFVHKILDFDVIV